MEGSVPEVKEKDKGQQFLTRTFLKNEAFANKNEGVSNLNRTMSTFTSSNIKELGKISKQLSQMNSILLIQQKATVSQKDLIRREDPTKKLIKEVDDLEELMRESNEIAKSQKRGGAGGFIDALMKAIPALLAALPAVGLLGWLLTGDDKYTKSLIKTSVKAGSKIAGIMDNVFTKTKAAWKKTGGFVDDFLVQPVKSGWKKASSYMDEAFLTPMKSKFKKMMTSASGYLDNFIVKSKGWVADFATKGIKAAKSTKFGGFVGDVLTKGKKFATVGKGVLDDITGKGMSILKKTPMGKKYIKLAAKYGPKKAIELMGKAIPFAGAAVNAVMAVDRAMKGDWVGAGMEVGAGVADLSQLFPPLAGTGYAVSTALEVGLLGRDVLAPVLEPERHKREQGKGLFSAIGGMIGKRPNNILLQDGNENLESLNPKVRKAFYAMAKEYGRPIQVNSAFRTNAEQKALYAEDPTKAAFPGTSPHEKGLALDIQTLGPNGFSNWGLAAKYGFNRPIPGREPWHMEYGSRSNTVVDSKQEGDPVLPQSIITSKFKQNARVPIDLSDKSIQQLTEAMKGSFKGLLPTSPPPININPSMRG